MKKLILFVLILLSLQILGQTPTVGLFSILPGSFEGYTLFAPLNSTTTYLIDHCGKLVNTWESAYEPGHSVYLLENGELLRAGSVPSSPSVPEGGYGGFIQKFDWDGHLLWEFSYANDTAIAHHDIEYLPNGNILALSWEIKSVEEAIAAGRNPSYLNEGIFYPMHIIEIEPIGIDSGTIVWRWHAWDHLVQDYDPSKENYGVVADHPELLNINYRPNSNPDWLHCNSIDYNPALDQILISSRHLDEIYIIDHSTTTSEAEGHTGGNSGKGGDILYRWGNPEAYDRGTPADKKLFSQHDAHWIDPGLPDEGKILVFNNGVSRPGPDFTSIDIIEPSIDAAGNYIFDETSLFAPLAATIVYQAPEPADFYSTYIGGAQRLPNGNTLICAGPTGYFFETDVEGNIVWEYVNPVTIGGIVTQGNTFFNNQVFRSYRYPADYPGMAGVDLSPGEPIEINPHDYECPLSVSVEEVLEENTVMVYPNPASQWLFIDLPKNKTTRLSIFDVYGRLVLSDYFSLTGNAGIDISMLSRGVYLLKVKGGGFSKFLVY